MAKMTKEAKSPEKALDEKAAFRWRIASAAIAAALAAAAIALNLFAAARAEAGIRENVNVVLAARFRDVFAGREAPEAGSRAYSESGGRAFEFVFLPRSRNLANNAAYSGDLIFVVPAASFSGPALSVFYYAQDSGARFLGNCQAPSGFGAETEISSGNLKKWTSRIEAAAHGFLDGSRAGAGAAE